MFQIFRSIIDYTGSRDYDSTIIYGCIILVIIMTVYCLGVLRDVIHSITHR